MYPLTSPFVHLSTVYIMCMYIYFSHVFQQVEKNSIEIWKYQMYFLVTAFHNINEPPHGKTNNLHMRKQRRRSASRFAKLISAFVFATRIVQFLFYLNPKFQASSSFLCLYSPDLFGNHIVGFPTRWLKECVLCISVMCSNKWRTTPLRFGSTRCISW